MGRLVTKGTAKEEFEAEVIELDIYFTSEGHNTGEIMEGVNKKCEKFLSEMSAIGINPEAITIEDCGISKSYDKDELYSEKVVTIKTRIDIKLCTYIFSVIKTFNGSVRYRINYNLLDESDKHEQVLKEAVEDSRRQAEIIAASLGKEIVGIESVNDDAYMHRNLAKSITVGDFEPEIPAAFESETPLSDKTALPTVGIEEEISIAWVMED